MTDTPVRFGFILLPDFTLTAFAGMIDMLRLASDEGDQSRPLRCRWEIVNHDLSPVRSSTGVKVVPSGMFGDPARYDYLVVVGGLLHPSPQACHAQLEFIRAAVRADATIVGLCTGAFTLVEAGIMTAHRVCVSWFHYWDFRHRFPAVDPALIVADQLYVVDGQRITCSGGRASIDVAAKILERHLEAAIVQKALHILLVADAATASSTQPLPPGAPPVDDPLVQRAMLLMEQNVGRQLSLDELGAHLDVSARHLGRLFKAATGVTPQAYARSSRLRAAAWMLSHTRMSVTTIASECGFADASHMGRQFRGKYHMTPADWRRESRLPRSDATSALSPGSGPPNGPPGPAAGPGQPPQAPVLPRNLR